MMCLYNAYDYLNLIFFSYEIEYLKVYMNSEWNRNVLQIHSQYRFVEYMCLQSMVILENLS